MLADHLPEVLDDELARAQGLLGADAPAFALGAEALQALDPLVPLDVLVVALLPARADAGRALSEAHPEGDRGEREGLELGTVSRRPWRLLVAARLFES